MNRCFSGFSRIAAMRLKDALLQVFFDGSGEAHPMREVDFRTLALKKAQISSSDLALLRELLSSPKFQHLDPEYHRYLGE